MAQLKKTLLVFILGILGLLLTLAGLNLIALTTTLLLYVGIALLVVTVVYYLLF